MPLQPTIQPDKSPHSASKGTTNLTRPDRRHFRTVYLSAVVLLRFDGVHEIAACVGLEESFKTEYVLRLKYFLGSTTDHRFDVRGNT